MIIGKNPSSSGGGGGGLPSGVAQWKKYTIPYTQVQTAALTNTLTLVTLPAKTLLYGSLLKHSLAFAGTGITSCGVLLSGYGQTLNGTLDVFQAAAGNKFAIVDQRNSSGFEYGVDITATQAITTLFTATGVGHTLNDLIQGSVDIWLETITLP